jgi:hypothetical protein
VAKLNCWEVRKCGREPGGARSRELGVCLAATDKLNNGKNGGKNGGRMCWAVVGTYCGGPVTCLRARELVSCVACEFFKQVKDEEGQGFRLKNWGMSIG